VKMAWAQRGGGGGTWSGDGGWGQTAKPAPKEEESDLLWAAVEEAVKPILELEKSLDENKLQKQLRTYFNKAAKSLSFRIKPVWQLVNEYADNVFGSLFASLGDREWLVTGQADFILVLDAGIKDNFPKYVLIDVPQEDFEQMVLAAHDRAFDEQRFGSTAMEAVHALVQGAKTRKRVWNAVEQGRKEAQSTAVTTEDFAACWIDRAIALISEGLHGDPESCLTADAACELFHALMDSGGLPLTMTQEHGPPPSGWPLIDEAVQTAYITHTNFEDTALPEETGGLVRGKTKASWAPSVAEAPAKRLKGGAKGKSKGPYSAF